MYGLAGATSGVVEGSARSLLKVRTSNCPAGRLSQQKTFRHVMCCSSAELDPTTACSIQYATKSNSLTSRQTLVNCSFLKKSLLIPVSITGLVPIVRGLELTLELM